MRFGGRWNTAGKRIVYTAGSQSLAILEMLAHLDSSEVLGHYTFFRVEFEALAVEEITAAMLPKNWRSYPAPRKVQEIGDAWVEKAATPVLLVPSAIVPVESNFLLNPGHPGFATLTISGPLAYRFDARLG